MPFPRLLQTVFTVALLHLWTAALIDAEELLPLAEDYQVNNSTTLGQYSPYVAADNDGDFVVVWQSEDNGIDNDSRARLFHSDGTPKGPDFAIHSYITGDQQHPNVAMDPLGGFMVTWNSSEGIPSGSDGQEILTRRFTESGDPLGGDLQINTYTTGDQTEARIKRLTGGDFVVAWNSYGSAGGDTDRHSIQARLLDASGQPKGEQFQVNTYTTQLQLGARIAAAPDGGFAVVWQGRNTLSNSSVSARRFQSDGSPIGDEFVVQTRSTPANRPNAVFDASGNLLIGWRERRSDDNRYDLLIRRFASDGQPIGTEMEVASSFEERLSNIAIATSDDQFLVTWDRFDSDATEGDPWGLQGRLFESSGQPVGQVFEVNSYTTGFQTATDVVAREDGTFVVAWESYGSGGDDNDYASIQMRRLGQVRITGRAWLDQEPNGLQDGGEPAFAGLAVELFTLGGESRGSTVTDADGFYAFSADPGTYYLAFTEPDGHCFTTQDQGDDTFDSDVNPVTLTTLPFEITLGAEPLDLDAGLVPDASVGDRVWLDDGDGVQAGGEPGIAGVTVRLYDDLDNFLESTTTDTEGRYGFAPGPGSYYLEVVLPPDTAFAPRDQGADDQADSDVVAATGTTPLFHLGPGQVDSSRDIGLEPAVIGDRVWLDADGDGRRQPHEAGLAGVTVRLLDASDAEIASTTTAADGVYGFSGVPTGTYRIEVVPPMDGVFSSPNVGSDDLIDSDVDPTTGRSELFTYDADAASRSWDAGIRLIPLFADGFESGDTSAWLG